MENIDDGFLVDPYRIIYKVYALPDENKCITDIWSTGNQALGDKTTEEEIMQRGYVLIDEGTDGEIYGRAQVNYLEKKHGKPMYDERMLPNFRWADGSVVELQPEEKQELFIKPQEIQAEKIRQADELERMMKLSQQTAFLIDLPDSEAAKIPYCYDSWQVGVDYKTGDRVESDGKLWKRKQDHTSQENWKPSIDTASLWEVIDVEHAGTIDDPIPYDMNMEVFKDKYYIENDVIYKCIRDSGQPLYASCASLVGNYFELVE